MWLFFRPCCGAEAGAGPFDWHLTSPLLTPSSWSIEWHLPHSESNAWSLGNGNGGDDGDDGVSSDGEWQGWWGGDSYLCTSTAAPFLYFFK